VAQLFEEFERAAEADRRSIATQIFNELEVHATLEEEIFYPAVRDGVDIDSLMEEEIDEVDTDEEETVEDDDDESDEIIAMSFEEHQSVRDLMKQLKDMDAASVEFPDLMAELKEAVEDHVAEEEELILPAAQLTLDLESLGTQMEQRRITLVSSMAA
jgi:iron-sulfur cluster repair protein YtfE (RIC family)